MVEIEADQTRMLDDGFILPDFEGARESAIIEMLGLEFAAGFLIGDGAILQGFILSDITRDVVIDIFNVHRDVRPLVGDWPAEHGEALDPGQGNGSVIHRLHRLQGFGYGMRGFQRRKGHCAPG